MPEIEIDADYLANLLNRLLTTPSPSGYTDAVVRLCARELERLGVPYELTRRGAIRATLAGHHTQPARAVVAHVDTLGAQVKRLKDNGRLELVPIGHWSARFAEGARCTVFTDDGAIRGTILPLKASGHTFNQEIDTQPVGWPHVELRVDVVAHDQAMLASHGINVGDIVAIDSAPEFSPNGFINARHLDDKAGVAVLFASLAALRAIKRVPPVAVHFLFTIAEEVGVGASAVLHGDVASMVTIDNGTTAPGQNSRETGVTVAMADQTGPFDYHLTQKLLRLARENDIPHQRDVFRYYRSDSAAALEAGNDIRTALLTFGIDASHGWERIHLDALVDLARLVAVYVMSEVELPRDANEMASLKGFTRQPTT
ncbi:MAG: osmoprotectant NAGGN system M42 family peptidase [Alphaproteobacteria bacterium]